MSDISIFLHPPGAEGVKHDASGFHSIENYPELHTFALEHAQKKGAADPRAHVANALYGDYKNGNLQSVIGALYDAIEAQKQIVRDAKPGDVGYTLRRIFNRRNGGDAAYEKAQKRLEFLNKAWAQQNEMLEFIEIARSPIPEKSPAISKPPKTSPPRTGREVWKSLGPDEQKRFLAFTQDIERGLVQMGYLREDKATGQWTPELNHAFNLFKAELQAFSPHYRGRMDCEWGPKSMAALLKDPMLRSEAPLSMRNALQALCDTPECFPLYSLNAREDSDALFALARAAPRLYGAQQAVPAAIIAAGPGPQQ